MKKYILSLILFTVCVVACNKFPEPYDNPFVYFEKESIVINDKVTLLNNEYKVFLSSKTLKKDLTVQFSITPGNGLKQGVDYDIVTKSGKVVFYAPTKVDGKEISGTLEAGIFIKWYANPIDPRKDNTLTITLTNADQDITLGLPGPDKKNQKIVFTKISE